MSEKPTRPSEGETDERKDAMTEKPERSKDPRVYTGVDDSIDFVAAMMTELTGEPVDPQSFAWMRDLSVEQVDLYIRLHEQEGLSHEQALEEVNKMSRGSD
jgi:hypothetical protein